MAWFSRCFSKKFDDWASDLPNKPGKKRLCYECGKLIILDISNYEHEGGVPAHFELAFSCYNCGSLYELSIIETPIYSQKFRVAKCVYHSESKTTEADNA